MLHKTPLHEIHLASGAKMGAFAGYDMPLFYRDGVMKEHEWTRSHCGIFDVSHMGQLTLSGEGAAAFLERVTPSAFQSLETGQAQYTVLTNEAGGIIDDLIVTRLAENEFFIVVNAGRKNEDIAWMKKHLPRGLHLYHMKDHALIAVQGPWGNRVIHEIFEYDATALPYMRLARAKTRYGVPVFISRLGYTGEDGFEVSLPNEEAPDIWQSMLGHAEVKPVGLAARDSLRLEMGYPLYGHDIDEKTTVAEAGLNWVVRKENRNFIGAAAALEKPTRKRVGVRLTGEGVAREGAEIRDTGDAKIGALTSGGFSPTLKQAIGMGYVDAAHAKAGEKILVNVRDRDITAEVAALPFVAPKTKSAKKKTS